MPVHIISITRFLFVTFLSISTCFHCFAYILLKKQLFFNLHFYTDTVQTVRTSLDSTWETSDKKPRFIKSSRPAKVILMFQVIKIVKTFGQCENVVHFNTQLLCSVGLFFNESNYRRKGPKFNSQKPTYFRKQ